MPLTGFATTFTALPPTTPWRQDASPPAPPPGKVGADAAVLGGAVSRIVADKARRPFGRIRTFELVLYPAWMLAVAALNAMRAGQLPDFFRNGGSAGVLAAFSIRIGAALPLLAVVEGGVAIFRFAKVVRKRGRLDAHIRDTAAGHAQCEAALRRRRASRTEAAQPAERAMRRQQRQALRENGNLDAFLVYRHSRAERGDCSGKLLGSALTLSRDAVVQGAAAASGAAQGIATLVPTVAAALPWTGIAGCAASVAMSIAHIASGIVQRHQAGKQRAELARRREALQQSPLAAALAGLERNGAGATICKAQPLSTRQQGIVGQADPAQLHKTTAFYCTVMKYCDGRLGDAIKTAKRERRNAGRRIAYGSGTLLVNGAALGLTVAALTSVTAATAGLGLAVIGGVLGLCWLGFAVWKMIRCWKERHELQDVALTARLALEPAAGDDAATAKAIGTACAQIDDSNVKMYRHLIAARVMQHLQARGSAQALAERSLARALMRSLGADAEVVAAIESAQSLEQCRVALKLVLRHLDGAFIDPAREHETAADGDADGASESTVDDRMPLLGRMAEGASAG